MKEITIEAIKARCLVDSSGCWIWQGAQIGGMPYWATYDGQGKRENVNLTRRVLELSGAHMERGARPVRYCLSAMCVNPDCLSAPARSGMFSGLVARSQKSFAQA